MDPVFSSLYKVQTGAFNKKENAKREAEKLKKRAMILILLKTK